MRFKAYIIRPGLFGLTKSDLRAIGRKAIENIGLMWHYKYKAFHFKSFAAAKYGYSPRSPKYRNAEFAFGKRRNNGPPRPLVFTGESERLAMASNTVRAKATSFDKYHVEVIVNAPALNFKNKNTAIDMRREMTTVIPSELKAMELRFAQVFTKGIEQTIARKRGIRRLAG